MSETAKPEKKKNWFLRHPIISVILVFLVIGIVGASSGGGSTSQKVGSNGSAGSSGNEEEQKPENTVYQIGDQIKLGDVILTVNEMQESAGGQFTKPADGNQWIELNMTIENTGKDQEYVTTLGQMFIIDQENNQYQVAVTSKAMENPGTTGLDGAVVAGAKKTGWVGFEVPLTAVGLKFQYNANSFGYGGNVLVELGK